MPEADDDRRFNDDLRISPDFFRMSGTMLAETLALNAPPVECTGGDLDDDATSILGSKVAITLLAAGGE